MDRCRHVRGDPVSRRPGWQCPPRRAVPGCGAQRQRVSAIAVQAHGFGANGDIGAVDGAHALLAHHGQRLVEGDLLVVVQRTRRAALDQRAIGVVAAVGEHFFLHAQAGLARHGDHLAAGEAEEHEVGIVVAYRAHDGLAQLCVAHGHVVERAMRLHMGQLAALCPDDAIERADLVQHVGVNGLGVALHLGTAKVVAIGKARVRADGDAVGQRPLDGLQHGGGIAGVPAAGDIGRTDQREQRFVVAAAFAEVGVEVDLHQHLLVLGACAARRASSSMPRSPRHAAGFGTRPRRASAYVVG